MAFLASACAAALAPPSAAAATATARLQQRRKLTGGALLLGAAAAAGLLLAISAAVPAFTAPPRGGGGGVTTRAPLRGAAARAPRQATDTDTLTEIDQRQSASQWRLNVGHAIDVLRTEIEELYSDGHTSPDFTIFSEDVVLVDARAPSFELRGLPAYKKFLSGLRWSVRTACERSRSEITSMRPPVNNELYIRWQLVLWPKDPTRDMMALAQGLLGSRMGIDSNVWTAGVTGMPLIIEGYSRYEFHPWSAEIVRHTIDVTNPPMYLADLFASARSAQWSWSPAAVPGGFGAPTMRQQPLAVGPFAAPGASAPITGSTSGALTSGSRASAQQSAFGTPRTRRHMTWKLEFGLPQSCEDDFECNDGRANFPLQCCEVPLLGGFCCEPDDFEPLPQEPAYVPLPVPVEDTPWQ